MIECKFINSQDSLTLCIKGHAGYAERGKDIVCSAISTLFFTLANGLNESLGERAWKNVCVNTAKEVKTIEYRKSEATVKDAELMFFMICGGIESVARQYPYHVSIDYIVEGR